MTYRAVLSFAVLAGLSACSFRSSPEPRGGQSEGSERAQPGDGNETGVVRPGVSNGLRVITKIERKTQGEPARRIESQLDWTEARDGRGQTGRLTIRHDLIQRGDEWRQRELTGRSFDIVFDGASPRFLEVKGDTRVDVTGQRKGALASTVVSASARSSLLPEGPVKAGDTWQVKLGRYLERNALSDALPDAEGKVEAQALEWLDTSAGRALAIRFEIDLRSAAGTHRELQLRQTGTAHLLADTGLPIYRRVDGSLKQANTERRWTAEIQIALERRAAQ